MQLKEFDIILDIKRSIKNEYIEVVRGDYGTNVLNIQLQNGLNNYDLTNTKTEIVFAKPDGTTVIQDENNGVAVVNATEGRMTCTLNTNTIAAAGKVVAEVRVLSDIDDMLLTSTRFDFFVRRAIFGDDTIKSTNEWPLLKKLLEVSESEELRETEELIRQSNEEERIQNEQTREDNEEQRIVKETERGVAESTRINSENERIANEEVRRTNEQNRQSNEVTRIEEESIRQSNEVTRNENEDIRISQEESRVLAEESRESNETIRQQNENERESNEVIRVSNEDERELNESNRVSAETDRVQAEITRQEGYNQAIDNFSTDSTQAINDFNTQGQQKINDFVTETERVEAIYPTRLTNVENDLAEHKLDYEVTQEELEEVKDDLAEHKLDYMAHRFRDLKNDKVYKFGFQVSSEGNPQIIYEEVIE